MKQLAILLFVVVAFFAPSCKKDAQQPQPVVVVKPHDTTFVASVQNKTPQYAVVVDPQKTTVASGGSVTFKFHLPNGIRISSLQFNNKSYTLNADSTVSFAGVQTSLNGAFTATDSASVDQLKAINDNLTNGLGWADTAYFQRKNGGSWVKLIINPCAIDYTSKFWFSGAVGIEADYTGKNPCTAVPAYSPTGIYSHWSIDYKGTTLTLVIVGTKQIITITIVKLTSNYFEYMYINPNGDGIDYRHIATLGPIH